MRADVRPVGAVTVSAAWCEMTTACVANRPASRPPTSKNEPQAAQTDHLSLCQSVCASPLVCTVVCTRTRKR